MKANELMVGDWVNYRGICNRIAPADFCHFEWIDEIRPIPLTAEILEKNGFVKGYMFNNVWNYIKDYKRLVIVYTGEAFNIQGTLIEFKHVHKLQHALRLCGITREIII